ncbi:MAG: KUP/HAK/KT family potassium transporter, partial [Alphaproteobacteria bacterium]|nr:KUP/HAK/KT family potassium transporter [Alphaproteobacteria bacterium]
VLSAVEGLTLATTVFEPYVVPITCVVIFALFWVQRQGTARVGAFFGRIMCAWFAVLAVLGIVGIAGRPEVLEALNPAHAVRFFLANGFLGFVILGSVVLAVTGVEALYADMGHFGRKPIRRAWLALVWPALVLNYFGQGALLLETPEAARNPFFLLAPDWALYPMVALATLATIIASQAVISGAFSVARQAVQLGFLPRLEVLHTSEEEKGQIYLPQVNWILCIGVLALILGFQSSSALASAYGIAVTGTMVITTTLAFVVVWRRAGAVRYALAPLFAVFLTIDLSFFSACALKALGGGWVPIAVSLAMFTLMTTWTRGRKIVLDHLRDDALPVSAFLARVKDGYPHRVAGTAIFMTGNRDVVPYALLHNLKHNKVLHERVVLLNVATDEEPRVPESERVSVEDLGKGFHKVVVRYGFKESPDVPRALGSCAAQGLGFDMMSTSFFLGRERLVPSAVRPQMALWRERLFIWLSRNSLSATEFFQIPSNRVVELGAQVEV